MNLDPNWVGAIGQWAGATFTFAAVVVALHEVVENRKQSHYDRYDSARPVLSVSSKHDNTLYPIRTQQSLNQGVRVNAGERD